MATRVFSQAELDQLRRFPETITDEELVRYFTLTPGDVAFIERHRGAANRLGIAVQLCVLPWLGFVLTKCLRLRNRRWCGWRTRWTCRWGVGGLRRSGPDAQ